MGMSQKLPVHIPTFLQQNHSDPAVKVSGLSFTTTTCALLYLSHRISFQSYETIYFPIFKQYFSGRLNPVPSSVQQPMHSLLAWIIPQVILCSSSKNLYTNTRLFNLTLRPMTCSKGHILSSQEGLVATSCYLQIILMVLTLQNCTTFYMQESWMHIMQM